MPIFCADPRVLEVQDPGHSTRSGEDDLAFFVTHTTSDGFHHRPTFNVVKAVSVVLHTYVLQ